MNKENVTKKLVEYGFRKKDFRFVFDVCILNTAGSTLTDQLLVEELSVELPEYKFTIIPEQYVVVISI